MTTLPLQLRTAPPPADLRPRDLPAGEVEGLYVHIPFCFHKCHYCDFYSITRQTDERMTRFVDLLLAEADRWAGGGEGDGGGRDESAAPAVKPRTIFFGGGTPTLLPLEPMRRLLAGLRARFDFSHLDEWTVEANPATMTGDYCAALFEAGVNRLSFGAQSFNPGELATLERHHDPADVARSLETARTAGFDRLNLDLIYAVPGQDLASWMKSLEAALALGTRHLSCYGLTYESNTPMAVRKRLGHFRAVEDDAELEMFHATRRRLAGSGLAAYEISNYAAPGEECRHNLMYWDGGSYVGLGPSAASHVRGTRWRNRPHLGEWESAVSAGRVPAVDVEVLSPPRRAGELAMLQLRLSRGVNFSDFSARTGFDARQTYPDQLRDLSKAALIVIDAEGFRLTEAGLNVADAVAAEFLLGSDGIVE